MTEKRLGDIIDIKHGYAFDGEHIVSDDNGIVLVTPGNFKIGGGFKEEKCKFFTGEIPEDYILNNGDYIVTMTDLSKDIDTLGYSAKIPDNPKRMYLHNQRIGLLNFKDNDVCKDYIYYVMQTNDYQRSIANTSSGATVHHTSPTKIYEYTFKLPKYSIQKKIADLLGSYDSLIENNQKQINLLEEAAQRLYKEWFVDFRFPGYEDTKFIDGIPDRWRKELVGSIIDNIPRRKQIKATDYLDVGAIPIVDQSKNFIAGYTNDIEAIINIEKPVIVFGDHTRVLKYLQFPFAKGADGTQLIVSKETNMPQSLFYCSLIAVDLSNYHYARHFKYLKAETILVPTKDVADRFDVLAVPMFSMIQNLRDISNKLTQARDRLLPKLMSGEIEV